jgi:endo-beta-N-acetylglucosaminidase D
MTACVLHRTLKGLMRQHCRSAQIIWYDAVTVAGRLTWQNTLNELNRPFFEASDAIFINYSWKVQLLTFTELAVASETASKGCAPFLACSA